MSTITQTQFQDMMDKNLNPFRQVVEGSNTISIVADTEATFIPDGLVINESSSPAYMTNRLNLATGVLTASTEYDSPTYGADLNFIWTPSASNSGEVIVRVYVNETTPQLIRTYRRSYAGASADPYSFNATWYWGDGTGFDAKNKGIFFTVEFEHKGTITSPVLIIYSIN